MSSQSNTLENLLGEGMDKNGLYDVEYNLCGNNVIKHNTINLDNGKYINILLILFVIFIFIIVLIIIFLLYKLNLRL